MGNYVLIWIIAIIVLVIFELITVGLTSIWFAGGALAALFCALAGGALWLQLVIFVVVSLLLLFFTRPVLVKKMQLGKNKTNIDTLIGECGLVTKEISEFEVGLVKLNGQIWSALSVDGRRIEKDEIVVVERIEGVKLVVRTKDVAPEKEEAFEEN